MSARPAACRGREVVNCMTKDEITKSVHKNVDDTIKRNIELNVKSVTELLVSLSTVNSASSNTDTLVKSAAEILKVLYRDVVEQSAFVTIRTLSELGLLTQDVPEE